MAIPLPSKIGSKPDKSALHDLLADFEPAKYDDCKNWRAADWFAAIQLRYLLDLAPFYAEKTPTDLGFINKAFEYIRQNPTDLDHLDKTSWPTPPAVRDMTVGELSGEFLTPYKSIFKGQANLEESEAQTWNNSLYAVCQMENYYLGDQLPVLVDLSLTDESLLQDFKEWLQSKRSESDEPDRLKTLFPLTEAVLRSWSKNRVLGYVDLQLMCEHIGWTLTDSEIGDHLFPEKFDIDLSNKVRRTVRPIAEAIITRLVMNALEAADSDNTL